MREATLDDIDRDMAVKYSARDADATLRIFPILSSLIDQMGLREIYDIDMGIIPMVARMHQIGMKVDVQYFHTLEKFLTSEMQRVKISINKQWGWDVNPNSGDQVAPMLIALGLPLTKMTKGGARESTTDKVLESIRILHPVVGLVCDYRELAKLRDSFCVSLPRLVGGDGRIRCNFRITRVSSGRLSAIHPNLLAIPVRTELSKRIRSGFVAEEGHILGSWDLDQIEMCIMADESQDPTLCKLFIDGQDIHRMTGATIYGKKPEDVSSIERYSAKRVGFGVITGITGVGLLDQMNLAGGTGWTEESCENLIAEYFKIYPGIRSYIEGARAEARRYGYVRDRWGRIRYLPGALSDIPRIREEANRQSHSHKIQGGAQGLIKRAMKGIWNECKRMRGTRYTEPLLQIHDELLFELDDREPHKTIWDKVVITYLCNTTPLRVPVKAKGGYAYNWGALKD